MLIWMLKKNTSCPLCRKQLSKGSYLNRQLEGTVNIAVKTLLTEEERRLREERIKTINENNAHNLNKLNVLIINANEKKIQFLDIKKKWKLEGKKIFTNSVKQYFENVESFFVT